VNVPLAAALMVAVLMSIRVAGSCWTRAGQTHFAEQPNLTVAGGARYYRIVKWSRLVIILVVLLAIAGVAYAYYAPFHVLAWKAAGRSPDCPLANALQSERQEQLEKEYNDRIWSQSKLIATDPHGYELYQTPKGRFWIPRGSFVILPFNLAEQERKIYGTGDAGPHAGDVVLDLGANIGVTVAEELAAGAEKIVAVEPAPENVECLRRNYANEIATGRVIVYPKGVWDKDDTLTLRVDPHNSAADSFVIKRTGAVEEQHVPLTTIDKIVAELKLPRVDYMKFDIEGAEPKALMGARETIAKYKPRISITTYHEPDHPKLIPRILLGIRPDYQIRCGPCTEVKETHVIRPDVLYFK
jgi:FkbM family methyltransferase